MSEDYEQQKWDRRQALVLRAVANRMYQQRRQSIFEWREGLVKVTSLIAGSVAFAKVTNADLVTWSAVVVFMGSAGSLVFGWGPRARDAAKRTAEWTQLEATIEAEGIHNFTEAQVAAWTARANQIETGEPAQCRPLWARSYANACEVLKLEPVTKPSWWQLHRPFLLVP